MTLSLAALHHPDQRLVRAVIADTQPKIDNMAIVAGDIKDLILWKISL
jgi:hypothetical protein